MITGDFAQTNNCPATLQPSQACTISVTFTPTAVGSRSGSIVVTSNSGGTANTMQGFGMGLIFIPLTTVTNDPIPNERMGNATSIFNLMRNIGASIGISMVETIQTRHAQVHVNTLTANVTPSNLQAQGLVAGMQGAMIAQGGADPATAQRMASGMIENMIRQQAAIMSFNDVFWVLGVVFLCMLPLIFLMKPPRKKGGALMMH